MSDNNNQYKDMSLFNDIECPTLRARNRGVVMGNIALLGRKGEKLTPNATGDLLEYFNRIPLAERKPAIQVFLDYMKDSGFKAVFPNVS